MRGAQPSSVNETELMLSGYGLVMAEFLYRFPDHPHLLQSYLWQDYDPAPRFPRLLASFSIGAPKLDCALHSGLRKR